MVAKIKQKPAPALVALALASSLIATGCASVVGASTAGVGTGIERPLVHDPDNPYSSGSTPARTDNGSSESSYADPLRGPR